MTLETDAILERRRLRRRLGRWRLLALVAVVLAAFAAALAFDEEGVILERPHVGRLVVSGVIVENRWLEQAIAELIRNDRVRAVIVRIDSPGGTTYGGEALYTGLRKLAKAKPTVAVVGTLGASAAYLAAIGTDRIWVGETSLTGSIGVLMQTAEVSGLLDKIGVTAETLKAGRLKDEPSMTHPLSAAGRETLQALIDQTHRWFIKLVADRRQMTVERAGELGDGRVYNGAEAVTNGLADALGGEAEARAWLAAERGIDKRLRTITVRFGPRETLWREAANSITQAIFGKSLFSERLTLDGLVSVWQP